MLVGLLFLIPKQPLRFKDNVYSELPQVIERIVFSKKDFDALVLSARDGNRALSNSKKNERIEIGMWHDRLESHEISRLRACSMRHTRLSWPSKNADDGVQDFDRPRAQVHTSTHCLLAYDDVYPRDGACYRRCVLWWLAEIRGYVAVAPSLQHL